MYISHTDNETLNRKYDDKAAMTNIHIGDQKRSENNGNKAKNSDDTISNVKAWNDDDNLDDKHIAPKIAALNDIAVDTIKAGTP